VTPLLTPTVSSAAAPRHTAIESSRPTTLLKVVGLGGGGSNAVNRMIELGLGGVEFIACNTDLQALATCLAPIRVALGPHTTRGLGAGGLPQVGEAAAQESADDLAHQLAGADMVFLSWASAPRRKRRRKCNRR